MGAKAKSRCNARTVAAAVQCFVFASANVLLVGLTHRFLVLPALHSSFGVTFYQFASQLLLGVMLLAASVVNGAVISDRWQPPMRLKAPYKAALVSIPELCVVVNTLVHNTQLRQHVHAFAFAAVILSVSLFLMCCAYVSILIFDRLKNESPLVPLLFANPIVYLVVILAVFFLVVRIAGG